MLRKESADKMSRNKFLIDCGHGGAPFGKHYGVWTRGKMFEWPEDTILEGVVNRNVAHAMEQENLIHFRGPLSLEIFNPGPWNLPSKRKKGSNYRGPIRSDVINQLAAVEPNLVLVSIHCNAANDPRAHGTVIFTQKNPCDKETLLAKIFQKHFSKKALGNSRGIKHVNYNILFRSKCPGILFEMAFMTNRKDTAYINNEEGQIETAIGILDCLHDYEEETAE